MSRAVNLWRQLDRVTPPIGGGRQQAMVGHTLRWTLFLCFALIVTAMFGASGPFEFFLGRLLCNFLIMCTVGAMLALYRPKLYGSIRVTVLFGLTFVTVAGIAAAVARSPALAMVRAEVIPIAVAAVIFSVLFDARISVVATMVLAVLIGVQPPYLGTPTVFVLFVGGVAAAFSVRAIRRRDQVFRSILVTATAYVFAELAVAAAMGGHLNTTVSRSVAWVIVNAVASIALALMLLPPLEEFTGVDTYLKLLEWSDLNRPLMQRLSVEAPGTFAHTMRLANLAEAACNAIGANGLLARVGAYYHDVGKLKKPEYFVENQRPGRNPHDSLKPVMSASIIRNHVNEGLDLAEEYAVPDTVRRFITEHHGNGQITYFLEKAKQREGPLVNLSDFAYPGPVPQSAETAIVMLADGVEASAHVLKDPTPQRIRDVIEHIFRQRIEQGQLREAPLTLLQLEIVKEQFVRMMIGMYHHRIDYPSGSGGVNARFAARDEPVSDDRAADDTMSADAPSLPVIAPTAVAPLG